MFSSWQNFPPLQPSKRLPVFSWETQRVGISRSSSHDVLSWTPHVMAPMMADQGSPYMPCISDLVFIKQTLYRLYSFDQIWPPTYMTLHFGIIIALSNNNVFLLTTILSLNSTLHPAFQRPVSMSQPPCCSHPAKSQSQTTPFRRPLVASYQYKTSTFLHPIRRYVFFFPTKIPSGSMRLEHPTS